MPTEKTPPQTSALAHSLYPVFKSHKKPCKNLTSKIKTRAPETHSQQEHPPRPAPSRSPRHGFWPELTLCPDRGSADGWRPRSPSRVASPGLQSGTAGRQAVAAKHPSLSHSKATKNKTSQ